MAAEKTSDFNNASTSERGLTLSSIEHLQGSRLQEDKEDGDRRPLTPTETDTPMDEYPTGVRLVLLVGAVVLSVFLISLDQVSCIPHHL